MNFDGGSQFSWLSLRYFLTFFFLFLIFLSSHNERTLALLHLSLFFFFFLHPRKKNARVWVCVRGGRWEVSLCVCACVCIGQKRKLTLLSFRLAEVGWARHEKRRKQLLLEHPKQMPQTLGSFSFFLFFSGGEVWIKTNVSVREKEVEEEKGQSRLDESNFQRFWRQLSTSPLLFFVCVCVCDLLTRSTKICDNPLRELVRTFYMDALTVCRRRRTGTRAVRK